ncbi:MAG: protoheme IX farnesyltransferase [Planctomycetes bacterium]|nr:protoheme IX farnesyltransferase [Planctomycetota bacterium]
MSQSHALAAAPVALQTSAQAWSTLCKPRITAMVGFAAFVGGLLAAGSSADLVSLAEACGYIGLVGMASSVFNQLLERDTDARMLRTAQRPLVTGRLRARDAVWAGALLTAAGVLGLALRFNALAALLTLATMMAYVLVYTPLKRLSSLNTAVGAIPGAMPPLLGYVAVAGEAAGWAWYLFAILFAWQFPHFLAIAWLYREDYARAGLKMLPALPRTEGVAGRQSLLYSLALLPVSLLPALRGDAGWLYVASALVLGLAYTVAAALFALRETHARARAVVLISLVYLPSLYSLTLMDPLVRAVGARGTL